MKKRSVGFFCDGYEKLLHRWWKYVENSGAVNTGDKRSDLKNYFCVSFVTTKIILVEALLFIQPTYVGDSS